MGGCGGAGAGGGGLPSWSLGVRLQGEPCAGVCAVQSLESCPGQRPSESATVGGKRRGCPGQQGLSPQAPRNLRPEESQ